MPSTYVWAAPPCPPSFVVRKARPNPEGPSWAILGHLEALGPPPYALPGTQQHPHQRHPLGSVLGAAAGGGRGAHLPAKQWAAETTQRARSRKPPQWCWPSKLTDAMYGREWGVTSWPPMIRAPQEPAGGAGDCVRGGAGRRLLGAVQTRDSVGVRLGEKEAEVDRDRDEKRDTEMQRTERVPG